MEKLSYAYKIGSRLALTKHLPNLSRNQMLALGGVGGGLGALGLGLSAAEGKVLAKSLVDDVVGAAGKSGLADDVVSAAGKSGLRVDIPDKGKALDRLYNQLEVAKTKDYRNFGYQPFIEEEMIKSIKGSGSKMDYATRSATLKKMFPSNHEQLREALWARSRAAYQAASKGTISELQGIHQKLISSNTKPEEVPDLLRLAFGSSALDTSREHMNRQVRVAVKDLIKDFYKKK